MPLNWLGSLDALKEAVAAVGYVGNWSQGNPIVFRADTGEILRFHPSTKNIQFQGSNPTFFKTQLEEKLGLKKTTLEFGD